MSKAQKGPQLVTIDDPYEVMEMDQKTIQKRLNYWFTIVGDLKNAKKEKTNINSK